MPGPPKTKTEDLARRGSWRAKARKDEIKVPALTERPDPPHGSLIKAVKSEMTKSTYQPRLSREYSPRLT